MRTWKVVVGGRRWVTQPYGDTRIAVPFGEYTMKELDFGTYELSHGTTAFVLNAIEVNYYRDLKAMTVEPHWP